MGLKVVILILIAEELRPNRINGSDLAGLGIFFRFEIQAKLTLRWRGVSQIGTLGLSVMALHWLCLRP